MPSTQERTNAFKVQGRVSATAIVVALTLMVPTLTALAAQDTGKVLRIHQPVYPDVVDPQKSSFTNEIDILALAYEGLTRLDTRPGDGPGRGRVVGVQRGRDPDHVPPA